MSGGFSIGSAEVFYSVCMYLDWVFRDLIGSVGISIGFKEILIGSEQYHMNESISKLNNPE